MAPTIRKRGQNLKISGNKKKTKYKHNATKSVSSGRGTKKTLYWDQRSGSWKSTKNKPIGDGLKTDFSKTTYKTKKNYELSKKNVNESSEKKLKKIRDARKDGTAPKSGKWDTNPGNKASGSSTTFVKKTDPPKNTETPKTEVKTTEPNNNKLKVKPTTKGGPVKSGVEYAKSKGDDVAGYRRTKDTRTTKKLKKAGFTEDRLARLRKDHADWKAKRKKKKKV